jgi:DNA-binding transcriptional ArsR family regulator
VSIHGRHRFRLRVGDIRTVNLELVKAPHLSLVMLLTARASASPVGRTAHAARAAVRDSGRSALPPVLSCTDRMFPDVVATPVPPAADVSVDEQVQRLHDLPDELMVDDLTRTFGPQLPSVWRPPADVPRRWLDAYAVATKDAWSAVAPRWRLARPLLDLEARRVGAAVVRGGVDALVNTLHSRIHYENGEIWVPATRELTIDLGRRRLVLVPTIAGARGRMVGFDLADVVYLAYPVPGQSGLGERSLSAPEQVAADPLRRVLGRLRGELLRAAGGPISMSQLAATVGCSPRMTTYHCDELEAMGLLRRERRGQSVWAGRTQRGDELVDLLSD